jgi:ferredoxin-NADP reductase
MLETLADRGDARPVVLFAGNREWESIIFRDRIDELTARLDLKVVHVLEDPPPGWTAETGYLNGVEAALVKIGTPADRIHTERFDWV